jgi:hypothetical protein
MLYVTQDTRMAAYFLLKGLPLLGTEIKYQQDDERVYLQFEIPDEALTGLKRDFFENAEVPALAYANSLKSCMHIVREARELARESLR